MATYDAQHGQLVPVLQDNEANTVSAPAAPLEGHWFGVKHLSVGTAAGFITTVAGNGAQIETVEGVGLAANTAIYYPWRCYIWHFIDGAWRLTRAFHPATAYEPWKYTGADLLISGPTRIPLTFDSVFTPAPDFFTAVGDGTIQCARRFVGFIDAKVYSQLVMSGNNQDAQFVASINIPSGSAIIRQGYGMAGGAFSPRPHAMGESRNGRWAAVVEVGAVLEFSATDDIGQAGVTYVVNESALSFQTV